MTPRRAGIPRTGLVALSMVTAAVVSGCTGGGADRADGGDRQRGALAATLRPPAEGAAVADGATPGQLSLSVSRALFDAAPAVVVAVADDGPGMSDGAAQAERLGVPLLVQDAAGGPAVAGGAPAPGASAPGAPGSAAPATAASPELVAEIERLRPRAVLAVGAAGRLTGLPGRVTSTTDDLPKVSRPKPSTMSVLVRDGGDPATQAGARAASATARAAGAAVVPVKGDDLRADPAAVAALASGPKQVLGAGAGFGPADRLSARLAVAATGVQLPGGGQAVFPGRRLVALYGTPGTPSLGVLGEQDAEASIARAKQVAQPYQAMSDVPVVPTFEIIATVASGSAGPDGNYSTEVALESLRPWVEKAAAAGMYVVLDLQPGRTDFLTQAKAYAPLLELPYVGLALDAEWRLTPTQRPLQQIGSVGIAEVNSVVTWLADLTAKATLPQKLIVLHQFSLSMIRDEKLLDTGRDEVSLLIHMDGQGSPGLKDGTWGAVTRAAPAGVTFGWKNFYDEDTPMLTPAQTMTRQPTPVMISYQ